jgi:hypothetical protein
MKKNQIKLGNAAVVGENPEATFIIEENNMLHAVDPGVANLKGKNSSTEIIPILKESLQSLLEFSQGKISPELIEAGQKILNEKESTLETVISQIEHIYQHLPHHDRNELSSLIHHSEQSPFKKLLSS